MVINIKWKENKTTEEDEMIHNKLINNFTQNREQHALLKYNYGMLLN